MTDVAPRCPFCANVIKIDDSFWTRIHLKAAQAHCLTCQQSFDARDAHIMGDSFFHWAEQFRAKLTQALKDVPILPDPALQRALGNPHKDDTRLIPSMDELVRTCLRHHRTPLIEMARGREALLEVVQLHNEATKAVEAVAILGTSASESGAREWEQIVARTGMSHFVLFTYPGIQGAEPRVKRAVHAQSGSPAPSVIATNPQSVAAMKSNYGTTAHPAH